MSVVPAGDPAEAAMEDVAESPPAEPPPPAPAKPAAPAPIVASPPDQRSGLWSVSVISVMVGFVPGVMVGAALMAGMRASMASESDSVEPLPSDFAARYDAAFRAATPSVRLIMAGQREIVPDGDPRISEVARIMVNAKSAFRQGSDRIAEITLKLQRELAAEGYPVSPVELLDAVTVTAPEVREGMPLLDYEEHARAYRAARIAGRHSHTRTVAVLQAMSMMISNGELVPDSLPQYRKRDRSE